MMTLNELDGVIRNICLNTDKAILIRCNHCKEGFIMFEGTIQAAYKKYKEPCFFCGHTDKTVCETECEL
jgi:hypothetical protein